MQKLVGKKYFWLILFAICALSPLLASEEKLACMPSPNAVVSIKIHGSLRSGIVTYFANMEDGSRIQASRLWDGRILCLRRKGTSNQLCELDRLSDARFDELEKMYREWYCKKQKR